MPTRAYFPPDGSTSGQCGAGGTGGLWKVAKSLAAGGQSDGRLGGGGTSDGTPTEEWFDGATCDTPTDEWFNGVTGHWP